MRLSDECRSCGHGPLDPFLSLGRLPLAGAFIAPEDVDEPEARHSLDIAMCRNCCLVQLITDVTQEQLFIDNFSYFSSYSDDVMSHSAAHVDSMVRELRLDHRSLVVEVGSNDGYLLKHFVGSGVRVFGVEPAQHQAAAAKAAGVPTVEAFFGQRIAERIRLRHGQADVILANNVLAHVPNLNDFVAGIAELLSSDGVAHIENPYVRDLIDRCAFDTIYHEHHYYYSCMSLANVMRRHGLFLNHVQYFPELHGGTLRWHVGRENRMTPECAEYLEAERSDGLDTLKPYVDFAHRVDGIRRDLLALLSGLKAQGASIAAYGAAAKGSTLLNFGGVDLNLIDFVVDRNNWKHGKYMPGVRIPIHPIESLTEKQPDYCLLLAWNFTSEIVRQEELYRARGGKFIIPVPRPEVLL